MQKFRLTYGLTERQFKRLAKNASSKTGITGAKIVELLERRLDNAVYRLGFASSRNASRQLVTHGHIMLNKRKMTTPSYEVRVDDMIYIRPESRGKKLFFDLAAETKKAQIPAWLYLDQAKLEGKVTALPTNVESPYNINEVVEYFSR